MKQLNFIKEGEHLHLYAFSPEGGNTVYLFDASIDIIGRVDISDAEADGNSPRLRAALASHGQYQSSMNVTGNNMLDTLLAEIRNYDGNNE